MHIEENSSTHPSWKHEKFPQVITTGKVTSDSCETCEDSLSN